MCGIAGIYGALPPEKREYALNKLSSGLAHRGPDGHKHFQDGNIGLVHTRLSIIDLSERGDQPLYNEDRSLVLVCNGEIYNYRSIRNMLLEKGHVFSSDSDCEVILHLYEEYNGDLSRLLNSLTGMFAFALWDISKKELFIARDRIGIKPLYYYQSDETLIFSSEVRPIAETRLFEPDIDHTSLYEYFLLGCIPGPNTFFTQIKALEAGHFLALKDNKPTIREYWDIPHKLEKWKDPDEVSEAVHHLLIDIVKDHLIADVPVGTFLSGGVDSSLITAIAAGHHPGIHSFTASFPGEPEDEGSIAADTAKKLGTTHHAYEIKGSFFDDLPVQFRNMDQPFAISSALSLGRISGMAKQEVKVVLSGDGGDELFGGYARHVFSKHPSFLRYIPKVLHNDVLRSAAKLTGKQSLEQLRVNLKISDAQRFFDKIIVMGPGSALSFFPASIRKHIDQHRFLDRIGHFFNKANINDKLNKVLYVDMKTTLVDEMLTKCDRMTMINGIEGRVPFLDHRLVELAFSIPSAYKRTEKVGKIPLRQVLARYLGRDIAYREKSGFNAPLKQWLQKDEGTYRFALTNFKEAEKIPFLDEDKLMQSSIRSGDIGPTEVFEIVCMNTFYKNITSRA
jgi:asparagine synthase (glutamine-hydrolysing)